VDGIAYILLVRQECTKNIHHSWWTSKEPGFIPCVICILFNKTEEKLCKDRKFKPGNFIHVVGLDDNAVKQETAHKLYTNCTQTVYRLHTNCIQTAHKLYTNCTQTVYKLHTNCIQTAHKLYTNCTQTVYKLHTNCIQTAHKLYTNCTQTVYKLHTNCIQTPCWRH